MTNESLLQPADTYEPDNVRDDAVRLEDANEDEDRAIRALYENDGERGEEDELSEDDTEDDEEEDESELDVAPPRVNDFNSEEKVRLMASAADAVRASDIIALDLRELTIVTDFFLICTGKSSIQIRAIADRIEERLREQGLRKLRVEGYQEATWIFLDYGDVVAHVMAEEQRAFYHLEEFWSSAPELELELVSEPAFGLTVLRRIRIAFLKGEIGVSNSERTQAMNAPASTLPYPSSTPNNAGNEPTQAFSPLSSRAVPEPTQTLAAQPIPPGEDPLASPERRRQLEADLARLGVPPDEIRRLLSQKGSEAGGQRPGEKVGDGRRETRENALSVARPTLASGPRPLTPPIQNPKSKIQDRVTADDLQAFAAQLAAQKSAERVQAVEQAIAEGGRDLPEFRESTVQERMQAEALLRDFSALRRREKFREAEAKCRQALELVPRDAPALELLGDILQGVARTDEALAAYKRATLADPKRASAERKYADLLTRQQNLDTGYDPEAVPPNPLVSSMMSLWLPGMGQLFNGEVPKALFFFVCDALCALFVWATWAGFTPHRGKISGGMLISAILSLVVWAAALADARMTAKQKANGP